MIAIDSEYLYVTATASAAEARRRSTVQRGYLGTTAAAHANNAAITQRHRDRRQPR